MTADVLRSTIEESIATKQRLLARCLPQIESLCALAVKTLAGGGKIMFCGNGGSSCDAAHAAGELIGTFEN
jgi:D-sedoheptulose 7-phosphate isomerase